MQGYDIEVHQEKIKNKNIFVANCLNLGIASQGHTYEEALENIKDAIELYVAECPEAIPKKMLSPPLITRMFL